MKRTLFRTRIKFCGMTRAGDVRLAGELGVDAIGLVFAEGSSRRLEPEEARALRVALAPMVSAVAVFRDNTQRQVREAVRQVRPTLLQFHGDEEDSFCRSFGVPYIKAVAMGDAASRVEMDTLRLRWPSAMAFLFDAHGSEVEPGSGRGFDWSRLPTGSEMPFLLAGGLGPDNIYAAALATLPWGVDVASGIESAPGIKDGELMRRFVEQVRRADCQEIGDEPRNGND
ncbi:phosphoribosylanthranilate isomerase [Luteimonas sp. MJ293]|uniref:phosphoribosylanthranilate isomerase n=1 Tax=Luteimonas sp. MJ146 TaxID=3129240 RepID=UPI0031BB2C46